MRSLATPLTLAALLLVTACAGTPTDEAPGAGAEAGWDAVRTQQASEDVRPAPPENENLVLTGVRVRRDAGADRVVMRFSGQGVPGWVAGYVPRAVLEGSGEVVRLRGDAVLDVHATDTTWPAPDYYDGPTRLRARGDGPVAEVYVVGTVEGSTQVLVGVEDASADYRVTTRTGPARVVVTVRH